MFTRPVTILLFSPRLRDEHDLQVVLEEKGWQVVRAASARGFAAMMKARPVDLVVLDDPPWELARFAMTAMDASPDPVPRIWLSSLPEAPGHSGKLGVDALLLAPVDKDKLVDQIETLLFPRAASSSGSHPTFPLGSQLLFNPPTPPPADGPTATLAPRKGRQKTDGGWEEESTGNWP
jgi:DNA-binding NarL/FixJ family response regulator